MRLGISHLAINDNIIESLAMVKNLGLTNLEIVIPKVKDSDLHDFCKSVKFIGLTIESAQSILFNSGVSDFIDDSLIDHFRKVSPIYSSIGVKTLVLGSPTQRVTFDFNKLFNSFAQIDETLKEHGLNLCIEPNSRIYGGSYFFELESIVNFINFGKFSNISTMIDTHNLILENADPSEALLKYFDRISHIHVSEPNLKAFTQSEAHSALAKNILTSGYTGLVTYEALNSSNLLDEVSAFIKCYS